MPPQCLIGKLALKATAMEGLKEMEKLRRDRKERQTLESAQILGWGGQCSCDSTRRLLAAVRVLTPNHETRKVQLRGGVQASLIGALHSVCSFSSFLCFILLSTASFIPSLFPRGHQIPVSRNAGNFPPCLHPVRQLGKSSPLLQSDEPTSVTCPIWTTNSPLGNTLHWLT